MKNLIRTMLALVMVFTLVSIALARAAPTNNDQNGYGAEQVAIVEAQPIVVDSVPPMTTGFDVICNITNVADNTSSEVRQSTTVAEYCCQLTISQATRQAPRIVLLA